MTLLSNRFIALGSTALLGAGGAGALLAVGSTAASANAPLSVTNLDDSGAGSLRQALLDANAAPGLDVITFASGVSGTISLLSDFPVLTEGVDIQGPGRAALTIDGGWTSNGGPTSGHVVFDIDDAPASVAPWTISGLTIKGGNNPSGGGALHVYNNLDVPLDVHDVEFSNNFSTNGGGAVNLIGSGNVSFTNAIISGNSSGSGGGALYSDTEDHSTLTIVDSLITQNTSVDDGGALYLDTDGGNITIVGSVISDNLSLGDGGAIMVNDLYTEGSLTITDTVISGNHSNISGGALYSGTDDGSIFITDSTISNNTTDGRGGAFYISSTGTGEVVIANSTLSGNESTIGAGAMQLASGSKVSLLQSTVTNNTGGGLDPIGGISVEADDLTIVGSIVAGNAGFDIGEGSRLHPRSIGEEGPKAKSRTAAVPADLPVPPAVASDHSVLGEIDPLVSIVDGGGTKVEVADPMLGALADNGGPTMTHALLEGSPAIDAGPNPVPTFAMNEFDQRGAGFARIVFGVADAGAFELQEPPAPIEPVVPSFTG